MTWDNHGKFRGKQTRSHRGGEGQGVAGSYCRRQVLSRPGRCQPPGAQAWRAGWTSHPLPGEGAPGERITTSPLCTHSCLPSSRALRKTARGSSSRDQEGGEQLGRCWQTPPPSPPRVEAAGELRPLPPVRDWGSRVQCWPADTEMASVCCWGTTRFGGFVTQPKWHQELIPCPSSQDDWHLWAEDSKKAKKKDIFNDNLRNVFWDEELNLQINGYGIERTDTN